MSRSFACLSLSVALFLSLLSLGAARVDNRRVLYVRNVSSLSDRKITKALPAFQDAVSDDFAPIWGQDARLVFIGSSTAPRGAWVISFQNYVACLCYGFHDYQQGHPVGFVDTTASGSDWDLTFTHELFEMLADPYVDRAAIERETGQVYLVEVADPPEDRRFSYKRDGITISDFVTPAWYGTNGKGPYDFKRHISQPFQILKNGYACRWEFSSFVCDYG